MAGYLVDLHVHCRGLSYGESSGQSHNDTASCRWDILPLSDHISVIVFFDPLEEIPHFRTESLGKRMNGTLLDG